jgi:uncharacterized membrane protein YraQ (UPF0718 family)
MQSIALSPYSKRAFLAFVVLLGIGFYFWSQSRYPNLDEKAMMGGAIDLQDPLSFEAKYPIDAAWPVWQKIYYTTLNWVWTNRKGMTFGVFFGAAFLTLLRYLPRRSFRSGFLNAAMGFVVGAPLGVCVNCASPVAAGLYAGGTRAETTLAAMIASPTFNVVVLTMIFSLLPFYLAVAKIVLTLAVILVAIPLICRGLPASKLQLSAAEVAACLVNPTRPGANRAEASWQALLGFARDYARDLWFILRTTVPLMFAAGFLGAVLATLVPMAWLANLQVNPLTLAAAAALGVFAPVPMAFDVILATVLFNAGVPLGVVMTLLFTLGIFSVYSFIIVARTISLRTAAALTAVIVVLGIISGLGAEQYKHWQMQHALRVLRGLTFLNPIPDAYADDLADGLSVTGSANERITFSAVALKPRSAATGKLFNRMEAWHIGIDRPNTFSMSKMFTPWIYTTGSVAAADINNDGNQDVVMALLEGGIKIFLNDGTAHFREMPISLPMLARQSVFNAAPVDLDNDGWPDLVVTTFRGGNFVLWNQHGSFDERHMTEIKNQDKAVLALVVGFGDLDRNGYLDIVFGNHMSTREGWTADERDRNRIVFNDNGRPTGEHHVDTTGVPGDTLSLLISDFNQDGLPDLIEARDFDQPDSYYIGDGKGGFRKIKRSDNIIPVTTHTTMSVKAADLANDGRLELYLSQIAGRADGISTRIRTRPWTDYCAGMEREPDRKACQANIDVRLVYRVGTFGLAFEPDLCYAIPEAQYADCMALALRDVAVQTSNFSLCDQIPADEFRVKFNCETMMSITRQPADLTYPDDIPQIKGGNVLLVRNKDGSYSNIAKKAKLDIGGWSWDVKIYDFENRGLQDIFILNGFWGNQAVAPSKMYFRNKGHLNFEEITDKVGLVDYLVIPSAAAADFNNDGNIDLIASSLNGPLVYYQNNGSTGNSMEIELRDHIGNRFGIGSKVTIHYGPNASEQQLRELQLSGGFTAFDSPVLHFGLGTSKEIQEIDVEWPTGGKTVVKGPIKANARYTIDREAGISN